MCSLYINPWYREIVKYGKLSLEKYCQKHGYDFIYETEETEDGVYDAKRDIPWYKIQLMLKVMQNSDYDFVVWNDADSQIVNYEKKLESLIERYMGEKDVLVARDWQSTLNTGTMFIRNTEYSKTLLRAVWDNTHEFDKSLHEQASLGEIYTRNELESQSHIEILPLRLQNEFLAYWYSYKPNECFIVHATRCSHDRLGFIFTMDMFCTVKMDEETDANFNDRQNWMSTNRCLEDISHYRNNGNRRNQHLSFRYVLALQGKIPKATS